MTLPPLAADVSSIVFVGEFKPVHISPKWLHERDMISDADLQNSEFELLIPNEASIFKAGWLRCQAHAQRLVLETSEEADFEPLRDLAVDLLRISPDMPIAQLGLNRTVHFSLETVAEWHSVGDHLVNNAAWDKVLHLPGMRIAAFWASRTDGYGGKVNVQVEPSMRYPKSVFVSYNDHYDLTTGATVPEDRDAASQTPPESSDATTEKVSIAIQVLNDNWAESTRRFYDVLTAVSKLAYGGSDL